VPTSGSVDAPLARSPHDRKKVAIMTNGKRAVTHYKLIQALKKDAALIECRLETGRTHQVRVHMTSIGHALLGDPVYGRSRPHHRAILERLKFKRQALHAAELGFIHPVSRETLHFESEMPDDMQQLFSAFAL
jgi:23S rRNA pseudouridine1911/1915/1917 synthase